MTSGEPSWYKREGLALLTDLYELTMMAGYWKEGRDKHRVAFDYFFRYLPPHAGFGIAAGLDSVLDYLSALKFHDDDLEYLESLNIFDREFLDYLHDFRLKCNVSAIKEGTLVFPHEPVIQVEGTLFETQLIESALLNIMNFQTLIATKAARVCLAAEGEPVLEFGLRRAHGPDGGLSGSRAAYIGGCVATSNVLAGKIYGIPVAGTHAHSWVMSFPNELDAFRAFARTYPNRCTLLVDTYDTVKSGVPNAIKVIKEMRDAGHELRASIRLDSGDLAKLSKIAYKMMTKAGLDDPLIVASNDLTEDLIADLKRQGAKINAWGVGTHLITSYDCPALSGVYKLVALWEDDHWRPRIKISSNIEKATDPGWKRLVRYFNADGNPVGDVMYEEDENWDINGAVQGRQRMRPHIKARLNDVASSEELLKPVFENGDRVSDPIPVKEIREYAMEQIATLPEEFKRLRNPEVYRVILSEEVGKLKDDMLEQPDI